MVRPRSFGAYLPDYFGPKQKGHKTQEVAEVYGGQAKAQ